MISAIRNITNPKTFIMATMLSAAAITGGTGLKAQTQNNSPTVMNDARKLPKIVNTNSWEFLPKDALAKARLFTLFDVNGNNIIDDFEEKGLRKVLESNGAEQWDIYDENDRWIGYVIDGSERDADPSDTYEYAAINANNQRDYYVRVNIYTGEETFIKYHYGKDGDYEERYHNKNLDSSMDVEYTGPNNDKPKKMTETKAIYQQTDEFLKDKNGEIIVDEATGEPKRKEILVMYEIETTEFEYDENFNLIGVPKVSRKFVPIENKKHLNIKG